MQGDVAELTEARRHSATLEGAAPARINVQHRRLLLLATDLACGVAAGLAAYLFRFNTLPDARYDAILADAVPFAWVAILAIRGAYDVRWLTTGAEHFRRVVDSGFILLAVAAMTSFFTRAELSRGFVLLSAGLVTALTVTSRYLARKQLHGRLARGSAIHEVVVAGSFAEVNHVVAHMRRSPYAGFKVLAACVLDAAHDGVTSMMGVPVRHCGIESLGAVVEGVGADTLAVAGTSAFPSGALRRLSWSLERKPVHLIVAPAVTDFAGPRIVVRPVDGLPLLHIDQPDLYGARRVLKHLLDVTLAWVLLLLLSPIFLVVCLAIKVSDPGPVFFKQMRVGRQGRPFRMWKFRTMVSGAEERLEELRGLNEHTGVLFKIRRDPRVTRVGAFLRKHSIDEMPQLFNVIGGSMSIVGPRPPLQAEVDRYGEEMSRRLLVKPGMTGLWQINGRSDLDWEEAVRLDLYYVENWSPTLDFMVLWKTLAVVVKGRGGY